MSHFKHFVFPKSIDKSIKNLKTKPPKYWEDLGEKNILKLTNFTIGNVPAYRKFLKDSQVSITKVSSIQDFKQLPLIDKNNYLKTYNYKDLIPNGYEDLITTVSSTSGSTGEPFYFPRGEEQDQQYEYIAEIFLRNQFEIDKKRTLGIIGFGLGIWIGGIFTYKNLNKIAQKGYKLALAPVGPNKEIFVKTFKRMADLFDQVILMGYPPLVKAVIDEGIDRGINWKKHDLKIFIATEGFSEKFRDYLVEKTGIKNLYKDTLNIYGSVEFGTMSHETAIANLIRRVAVSNKEVFKHLFPNAALTPTLVQYYPHIVYFEDVDGEVVATGQGSTFPLIRYKFHDIGGVIPYDEMLKKLDEVGVDILEETKKVGIKDTIMRLPFVYVTERSDFVVILRGANIYPENIRSALLEESLENYITGKFTMMKKENDDMEEYLEVNVELKKNIQSSKKLKNDVTSVLVKILRRDNSEYNDQYTNVGSILTPNVILRNFEDSEYFKSDAIKQKWIRKK